MFHINEAGNLDFRNPAHTSGGREGFAVFALILLAGAVFWNVGPVEWLSSTAKYFGTLGLAFAVAFVTARWSIRSQQRRREKIDASVRHEREIETEQQLAAMKAKERLR